MVTLTNSTLVSNTARGGNGGGNASGGGSGGSGLGGAIFNEQGTLTLMYVTLAGNNLVAGSAGAGGNSNGVPGSTGGGALYNRNGGVALTNVILVNSTGGNDCQNSGGTVAASAQNLVGTHTGCGSPTLTLTPLLGPLADNGGSTLTMALLPGSPAIDAGLCLADVTADQRGLARPQGNGCDVGAFELAQPGLTMTKTVTPTESVAYHGEVTYTLALYNSGAADAAGVQLTDTLPVSTTFAHWVISNGANETADVITWNGTIAAGQAVTFTFVVDPYRRLW